MAYSKRIWVSALRALEEKLAVEILKNSRRFDLHQVKSELIRIFELFAKQNQNRVQPELVQHISRALSNYKPHGETYFECVLVVGNREINRFFRSKACVRVFVLIDTLIMLNEISQSPAERVSIVYLKPYLRRFPQSASLGVVIPPRGVDGRQ